MIIGTRRREGKKVEIRRKENEVENRKRKLRKKKRREEKRREQKVETRSSEGGGNSLTDLVRHSHNHVPYCVFSTVFRPLHWHGSGTEDSC